MLVADGSLMRPSIQRFSNAYAMNAEQFRGPRRLPVQVAHSMAIADAFAWPERQATVGVDHAAVSTDSPTKAIKLSPEAFGIVRIRIRPMPAPSSSAATAIRFRVGLAAPHALLQGS